MNNFNSIFRFFVSVWSYLAHRLAESTLNSLHWGLFMFACTTCEYFCQYKIQNEQNLYPLHAVPVHSTEYWLTGLNGLLYWDPLYMFGGISSECSSSLNGEVWGSAREWVKIFPCIFHPNTTMTIFLSLIRSSKVLSQTVIILFKQVYLYQLIQLMCL